MQNRRAASRPKSDSTITGTAELVGYTPVGVLEDDIGASLADDIAARQLTASRSVVNLCKR